jgi:signal transduction histidine kinase
VRFLPGPGLKHWLPLGFVIVLLFALVSIPIVSERRVNRYEDRLNSTVEPARALVAELHLVQGLAGGAMREYILTGSAAALTRYHEMVSAERQALEQLAPLAQQLGGPVAAGYDAVVTAVQRWRTEVAALLESPPPAIEQWMLRHSALNEQTLLAAVQLDRELGTVGETLRLQMHEAKRFDVALASLLMLLAVVAAVVVGWAGRRLHLAALAAEEARLDLVRVNESRAKLIRGFSHDVKNPLGGADGYAQLLEEGLLDELTERQAHGVRRLRGALRAALDLIDDLVDLARAEAGEIDLHVERFDLLELTQDLAEEYLAAAEAKGLTLRVATEAEPVRIESDRPRVRQILSNLFSNAVKYTPEGGSITAEVRFAPARREPDPQRWALASVTDTGPGIARDQQHLLFREFTRLDPTASRGAGLGLAISQGLAHALGGQITVQSELGQGSTFLLWLPDRRTPIEE